MVSNNIKSFISDLPKVELHLHLEGAIPLSTLLQLIEKYEGKNYITLTELQQKFTYTNFSNFLDTWYWKNDYIREYEDYEFISEHVANNLAEQNIRYAEIYFSPSDFSKIDSQPQKIATSIRNGLDKFSDKITIRLISDLVRDNTSKTSLLEKIFEVKDQGIIGIGLGGDEVNYPPKLFTQFYELAKKMGFHLTCHAGEAAGPEYIWQALQDLGVERIGHGTSAIKDENLVEHLVSKQIPVEMCPISNVKTSSVSSLKEHPIYDFYKRGMLVSVNTDDPKMFNTTMLNEYVSLIEAFDLELSDIYKLSQNSIKSAWSSNDIKTILSEELSFYFSSHAADIESGKEF
ncbi:MAG: adenosine deaminase [Candidatus Neomarinimicrobiota bacterium]